MRAVLAEILGPDVLIVLVIIALLFGGAKLPKLARSLGSAKGEFEKGLREGTTGDDEKPGKSESKDSSETKAEPKIIETKAIESSTSGSTETAPAPEARPAGQS